MVTERSSAAYDDEPCAGSICCSPLLLSGSIRAVSRPLISSRSGLRLPGYRTEAPTAVSTRLPLIARSSRDCRVDNPSGDCRTRDTLTDASGLRRRGRSPRPAVAAESSRPIDSKCRQCTRGSARTRTTEAIASVIAEPAASPADGRCCLSRACPDEGQSPRQQIEGRHGVIHILRRMHERIAKLLV